jgi:hypothetical protein
VLSGWRARAYGVLLVVPLPTAIGVVFANPQLLCETAIAANLMAILIGIVLYNGIAGRFAKAR